MRAAARRRSEPQRQRAAARAGQMPRQMRERLQQANAVDGEPEVGRRVSRLGHRRNAERLQPAGRRGDEIDAPHLLQRPAAAQHCRGGRARGTQPRAHGRHLVAHHRLEARALRRLEIGIVEEIERRLHARHRGAAGLGQGQQLAVPAPLPPFGLGDVLQEQDGAPGQGAVAADRGEAHLHQPAVRGGGDEAGRGRLAARGPHRRGLGGMIERRTVDRRIDRPPEPDQRRAEHRHCPGVVEQDPAFGIADHHRLLQLGDERRELIALLGHPGAGLPDAAGHLEFQRVALVGDQVRRRGDLHQRGPAPGSLRRRRGTAGKRPDLTCKAAGRSHMPRVEPRAAPAGQPRTHQPPGKAEGGARGDDRGERRAVRRGEARPEPPGSEPEPERHRHTRPEDGEEALAAHASMSRTCATRSRVEKGFVT